MYSFKYFQYMRVLDVLYALCCFASFNILLLQTDKKKKKKSGLHWFRTIPFRLHGAPVTF